MRARSSTRMTEIGERARISVKQYILSRANQWPTDEQRWGAAAARNKKISANDSDAYLRPD